MQEPEEKLLSSHTPASKRRTLLIAGCVFGAAMLAAHWLIRWSESRAIQAQELAAQYWVDSFGARLEGRIESNIAMGRGVAAQAAVAGEITQQQLDALVAELKDPGLEVTHVAIAPGLVISAINPLAGNEAALGLNYRQHPLQRDAVLYAIEQRSIVLVGPLTTVQGRARQLIARLPVFNLDQSLWGMVSVVIDLDTLLQAAGLAQVEKNYRIELGRVAQHPGHFVDRSVQGTFYISSDFYEEKTLETKIAIPAGQWILRLHPREPWGYSNLQWAVYLLLAFIAAVTIASVVYLLHRNFSLKREHIQHLNFLLTTDPLTRLSSRHQFKLMLEELVQECKTSGEEFAVLVIDIDHFKEVNDSLGHSAGDAILMEIARRLHNGNVEQNLVARLGGDEFILVLRHVSDLRDIESLARKFMARIAEVILVNDNQIRLTSSIGVSVFPIDADDAETLIQNADLAVFESKRVGRNAVFFFDLARRNEADRFVKLSTEIRSALDRGQFTVHFQPIYCVASKKISHCEALCRWQKEDGMYVSPGEFIVIAERCGLILDLGRFVLGKAVAFSRELKSRGMPMPVSLNRSAVEFASDEYTQGLIRDVIQQRISAEEIIFEITESLFMTDDKTKVANYWKLKQTGFSFAIDDFGTGYSSINYLRQFPVEYLKIDRSFVVAIDLNSGDEGKALVEAIIKMAKSLGMKVVAEGVETQTQFEYLVTAGCDFIQGYWFARPMSEARFLEFLDAQPHERTADTRKSNTRDI